MGTRVNEKTGQVVRFEEGDAFRTGMVWRRPIARWFERQASRLDLQRPLVHVCSGSSSLGEIRVDAVHPHANLRADAFQLPFKDESLGTVIYDGTYEISLPKRVAICKELRRVIRPGGGLLWKQRWRPLEGLFLIEEEWVVGRRVGLPRDVDLLIRTQRRFPGPKVGQGIKTAAQRRAGEREIA
jgi:hypothetical protein